MGSSTRSPSAQDSQASTHLAYRVTAPHVTAMPPLWSQSVALVERIVDSAALPVLVEDGICFRNCRNLRLVASQLRQHGTADLAGYCFSTKGSRVGERHPIADTDELFGGLRAVKDTVPEDSVVAARIEALICDYGAKPFCALTRKPTRKPTGSSFTRERAPRTRSFHYTYLQNRLAVLIVPTKHYRPTACRDARVFAVILAKHSRRAAIMAMRHVCSRTIHEQGIAGIAPHTPTLDKVLSFLSSRFTEISNGILVCALKDLILTAARCAILRVATDRRAVHQSRRSSSRTNATSSFLQRTPLRIVSLFDRAAALPRPPADVTPL